MPDWNGALTADEIATMNAHEFRRHFPKVDQVRRLLRIPWRSYRAQVVRAMTMTVTTSTTSTTWREYAMRELAHA